MLGFSIRVMEVPMEDRTKRLPADQQEVLLKTLEARFNANIQRHTNIAWQDVLKALLDKPCKLVSLQGMEDSGGEPDVVGYDKESDRFMFFDCCAETPKGRRSICYDKDARVHRKEHAPKTSAEEVAQEYDISILNEEQYRYLQTLGDFDQKSSSWIKPPQNVRDLGGAFFGDKRYDYTFIYHNGADSYYAARGFRGCLFV